MICPDCHNPMVPTFDDRWKCTECRTTFYEKDADDVN